ncbi:hypothetical protein QBC33DRAFT_607256 [Phialemonium atrogriseum]|uniref:Uncharacterized protein n=1 Tax=Phialemonium atrogriseum TaxID=1093897 RepID=A0AAJ0C3V0_9PEZI|nr:uncharacterized protein QBC33DRAFT_607256 [Phialemonium atrogriseum]KAK1768603.1 hypothetical protein QBC33DRAFT_607256 [Phialemonium atrogriseum]
MSCFARRLRPQVFFLPNQPPCSVATQAMPIRILLRAPLRPSQRLFATARGVKLSAEPAPQTRPPAPKTQSPAAKPAPQTRPPAPKTRTPVVKPTSPALSTTTTIPSTRAPRHPILSYADMLSSKGHPTLLYEAPSHFWLRLSCFGAGAFCISYTVVQYWTVYLHPPAGLSWWVPHAYGVVCMFMAGMGVYFAASAGGIVRRIRAVPAVVAQASSSATATAARAGKPRPATAAIRATATAATATATATTTPPPPLLLEVSTSRAVPFFPDKTTRVAPGEVKLSFRLAAMLAGQRTDAGPPSSQSSAAERLRAMRSEQEAAERARKYEMDHLMTAPFRHAGRAAAASWAGVKRGLSREGFAKIRVGPVQYKFDVGGGGWALDEGKALDRIVHVQTPR